MTTEKLKCQFCALDFTSVYKIIPHVYFGHRKKISRYVRDHQEVRLKCPAGCEYSHGVPLDKTAGPEVIFPALSKVFLELEDHMVSLHTKEEKLTMCPYCQKNLSGLIYWEHLEEHMGSNATPNTPKASASTPTPKTPTTPNTPTTPVTPVTPAKSDLSPKDASPVLKAKNVTEFKQDVQKLKSELNVSTKPALEAPKDGQVTPGTKSVQEASKEENLLGKDTCNVGAIEKDISEQAVKQTNASQSEGEGSSEVKASKSPSKIETAKSPKDLTKAKEKGGKETVGESSEEVVGFLESVNVESLPPLVTVEPAPVVEKSPKNAPQKVSKSSKDEQILSQLKEIERKIAMKRKECESKTQTKVEEKAQPVAKSAESVVDGKQSSDISAGATDTHIKESTKTTAVSEDPGILNFDVTEAKEKSSVDVSKPVAKGKVSDQRKAEIKKELAEIERKIKEKKEEEKRQSLLKTVHEDKMLPREVQDNVGENEPLNTAVLKEEVKTENAIHAGPVEKAVELKKEDSKIKSVIKEIVRSREPSGDKIKSKDVNKETDCSTRSRELSGEQEASKVGRNRNTSGDKRNTKSVWSRETSREPALEESGRRSASQESRDSQDRDSISHEKRDSASRRSSGGEPAMKPKPVLTEEMERKIIYGGFTNKKKESREDKLNAVKREIEARFKEEEARKLKLQAEKRKAEEKEREKQRINEEKLRKEREKLREERRKLKEAEKAAKENEEVSAMLEDKEPEPSEAEPPEEPSENASMENTPKSSPPASREKSPDQYQKIKMEIMKIDIEIEKKQAALHTDKKRKGGSRSPSPTEMGSPPKIARQSSPPPKIPKVPGVHELPKTNKAPPTPPEPEEDMDDLEMMMRDFQEREAKERMTEAAGNQPLKVDSLSQLRDSYAPKARSMSPSSPPSDLKKIIPSGFDQDGHPLPLAPLSTLGQDPVLVKAANAAARGIMGPARSVLQSHSLQLQCSVCKEEGPSASYYSAYQLLSHVFLAHRKKIVSRSRKARGMTLACPEGCGFTTTSSSQGVSIDFFNSQLPLHLASLCEHIISSHTGEDRMDTCQFCSLPLDHEQGWSWQHLANHRDARRVYCNSCNNFPFKNEEHKCSGIPELGLNSPGPFQRSTPSPAGALSNTSTPKSDKTTKSLEELAREVESGVIKPEELSKQRHLGSVSLFVCAVTDQSFSTLSSWMAHTRSLIPTGKLKLPNHLKCFCCQWRPARFDRGCEVVALQQLINHLLAEHNNPAWSDENFEGEKQKIDQMVKDHEKRIKREQEEKGILVPKLPRKCTDCKEIIEDSKTWKYHVLAHKFGEVFCSTCMKCVLGHQFSDHKVACTTAKKGVAKARVEKYRGDTWLDVGGKKLKVFFEYDENEDLGRVTIAKCMVKGNLPMMGVGVNHEEAANVLKEEVEDYFSTLKEQEDTVDKEQDRQALIDMFVELVKIDQENAIDYFLTVGGVDFPVSTKLQFTKLGKVQILAKMELNGVVMTEIGSTRKEAVNNLADKVVRAQSEKENKNAAKFCCVDCGSRFSKEVAFKLHQNIMCRV